ncbi:hypothetical protein [Bacteroides sp. 519]|uniref:hypothetical protein n=1 Tax=Bacteroides sp. 519 TaxID=2302937 RepID=UPI0013CFC5AE|nr:hypothetical protein [Bacteroides sp. 519]NDV59675.1 hypothetical protein [Bacteroides sp. 519]
MKNIIYIALILTFSLKINSKEYYGYHYQFSYFSFISNQSFGLPISEFGNGDLARMFEISAELNAYIKSKSSQNGIKKKIVYDICGFDYQRKRSLLEVYESKNAYHISINTEDCSNYGYFLTREDLFDIVEYIYAPNFKPFYINRKLDKKKDLGNLHLIQMEPDYEVYDLDSIAIKSIHGEFKVFCKEKDLNLILNPPFAAPIKYHNRYLIIDSSCIHIIENGRLTRKQNVEAILERGACEFNYPKCAIYSEWINFYDFDNEILFSYSYKKNKIYDLR